MRVAKGFCQECGVRPKVGRRTRCSVCLLRREPIEDQVEAAEDRRSMIPPELIPAKVLPEWTPPGTMWCRSCLTFVDLKDWKAYRRRCSACSSRDNHAAAIQRTYGINLTDYRRIKAVQGGRCAICRTLPKSERLAVDHDHKTGAVRGLLCSRCNHSLLGAAKDDVTILENAVAYLRHPPAGGEGWTPPYPTPGMVRRMSTAEIMETWNLLEAQNRADPAPF